jgi:hypothetical protein
VSPVRDRGARRDAGPEFFPFFTAGAGGGGAAPSLFGIDRPAQRPTPIRICFDTTMRSARRPARAMEKGLFANSGRMKGRLASPDPLQNIT